MFNMAIPWWELIVRSLVVYAFLLVILRITWKSWRAVKGQSSK